MFRDEVSISRRQTPLRLLVPAAAIALVLAVMPASAAVMSDLPDLSLARQFILYGSNINLSNADVVGNIGVLADGKLTIGGPSTVTGDLYFGSSVTLRNDGALYGAIHQPVDLSAVNAQVLTASSTLKNFTPDATYATWSTNLTLTGNGGVNVLNVGSVNLNSQSVTLTGTSSDYFVINVSGGFDLGGSGGIVAGAGVDPSRIIVNITGTGSTVTSQVNNVCQGTMLVPYRAMSFHGFLGACYGDGTSVEMKFMSDAQLAFDPFAVSTLGDYVWHDINGNGIQDAGEPGIAGATVKVYDSSNNLKGTTTTNASGYYEFKLAAGTYSVGFTTPSGYNSLGPQDQGSNNSVDSDANATTGRTGSIVLAENQTDLTWDAGFYQYATLGNYVWHDLNANGTQDAGEPGIVGATVNLYNSSNQLVGTTTTDGNGYYSFSVAPGTYSEGFVKPVGYDAFSPADQGGNNAVDSDANASTGKTISTTLISGQSDLTWDTGFYKLATLGNYVWHDLNANGIQDADEPGIVGATVNLYDSSNQLVGTTTTDANGYYSFSVAPGTYSEGFVKPVGYDDFSPADQGGNNAVDSDANASTGKTISTTLISGQSDLTWDTGFYKLAAIGNYVWHDLNANGIQDAGEPGIVGATVNLYNSSNQLVGTTTTDANGYYSFSVVPGSYSVGFVKAAGYDAFSPIDQGTDNALDSDADAVTGKTILAALFSGQSDLTWDSGLFQYGSLGDYVWNDLDGDGIQDSGEQGLPDVTVHLLDSLGNVVATTVTDEAGNYLFSSLRPGQYEIEFLLLQGYQFSPLRTGGSSVDSDADLLTGRTGLLTVISGQNDMSWDAGMTPIPEPATMGLLAFGGLMMVLRRRRLA